MINIQLNITMDKYEYIKPLGHGKFGTVDMMRDTKTNEIVAIKRMEDRIKTKYGKERVKAEIICHSMLDHPNIIKLYDHFKHNNIVYLVLEYMDGCNLYELSELKNIDETTTKLYITQIIDALIHCHENKVAHRDIKLENCIVNSKNEIKICDFGYAMHFDNAPYTDIGGTLDYISPEVVNNDPHDYKVDMWALGVLTYELLTNNQPFHHPTYKGTYSKIQNTDPIYPENLSANAIDFIQKLLKKNPNDRMSLEEALNHPFLI